MNKVKQLILQVSELNIDIICLTETWLDEDQLAFINLENYSIGSYYCREINKHGGILIATKSIYKTTTLEKISELSIERHAEFAGLYLENLNTVVLGVYRSPLGTIDIFFYQLTEVLNYLMDNFVDKKIMIAFYLYSTKRLSFRKSLQKIYS